MRKAHRLPVSVTAIMAVAAAAALGFTVAADAHHGEASTNALSYTPLTLSNGWTNAPFGTRNAAVAKDSNGIVHFKGAIAHGTNPSPFTLPVAFRPSSSVFVAVDMCNATNGRLDISSSGSVSVEAEGAFSNAQCFTSLEGVSFAK